MLKFLDWDLSLPTCCYITELLINRSLSLDDLAQSQRHTVTSSSRQFTSFTEMKIAFLRTIKEVSNRKCHSPSYRHFHYFRYLIFICKRKA